MITNLFIFEMANNHQGSVEHGKQIIRAMGEIASRRGVTAGIKFQYRDLPEFIHKDYRERKDVPHIPRFMDTMLTDSGFRTLVAEAKKCGLIPIATPFDEKSVEHCLERGIEMIKVASCSAEDWSLLEAIARAGKPVICSTGGLDIHQIDRLDSFFAHRGVDYALLHCVAKYPLDHARLSFLGKMARRYSVPVGYSGHEAPDDTDTVQIAVALGAQILERHVGIGRLNAYSLNPEQADAWVVAALRAREIVEDVPNQGEAESLRSLRRGVYAASPIAKGEEIKSVYFAMPAQPGQLSSGEFSKYRARVVATRDYQPHEPIYEVVERDPIEDVRGIVHDVAGMLREAGIVTGQSQVELSHHYGMDKFRQYGATIVNIVNREYCKKLVVLLPGQTHPVHWHTIKEETFQVLYGRLFLLLDGAMYQLDAGKTITIERGAKHRFWSGIGSDGTIVEEISTHHVVGDSQYDDPAIAALDPIQRKTIVEM